MQRVAAPRAPRIARRASALDGHHLSGRTVVVRASCCRSDMVRRECEHGSDLNGTDKLADAAGSPLHCGTRRAQNGFGTLTAARLRRRPASPALTSLHSPAVVSTSAVLRRVRSVTAPRRRAQRFSATRPARRSRQSDNQCPATDEPSADHQPPRGGVSQRRIGSLPHCRWRRHVRRAGLVRVCFPDLIQQAATRRPSTASARATS